MEMDISSNDTNLWSSGFPLYITDVEISPSFNGYSWLYKLQESSMNLTRDLA